MPFCQEQGAVTHLGTRPAIGGALCSVLPLPPYHEGPCTEPVTFPPTTFCCQTSVATCFQNTLSNTAELVGWLLNACDPGGGGFHPAVVGTCVTPTPPDFRFQCELVP